MKEIFISHISEEASLAVVLGDLVKESYHGKCTTFVSSDLSNLSGGEEWMGKLKDKLVSSDILIVLCSPHSLSRRWIAFEAGFAWARGIPLIPICHSGVSNDTLSSPFNAFQGIDLYAPNFLSEFYVSLEKHLGFSKNKELTSNATIAKINDGVSKVSHNDIYISTPMTSYSEPADYREFRSLISSVVEKLQLSYDMQKVYCVIENTSDIDDVDTEQESAEVDLGALKSSKHFMLIYPEKVVSSCLVEAGYALALGIPSTYFVSDTQDLPFMLREVAQVQNVRVHRYSDKKDLLKTIGKIGKWLSIK